MSNIRHQPQGTLYLADIFWLGSYFGGDQGMTPAIEYIVQLLLILDQNIGGTYPLAAITKAFIPGVKSLE